MSDLVNGIVPAAPERRHLGAPVAMPQDVEQESVIAVINDRLRGRLKYAISLGVLLGAALGFAGYKFAPVKFASSGNIHVASTGSAILYRTPDTDIVPRYEGYRRTQELLVTSPRVIDQALLDPAVAKLPLAEDKRLAPKRVAKGLKTNAEYNTEIITVTYEADDPATAQTVVNAVLRAYRDLYGSRGGTGDRGRRLQILRENSTSIQRERDQKQRDLDDILANSDYGTTDLSQVLEKKLLRVEDLKQQVEQLDIAIAQLPDEVAAPPASDGTAPVAEATMADLEAIDPELVRLHAAKEDQLLNLRRLAKEYTPRHLVYQQAMDDLELLNEKIAMHEEAARAQWKDLGGVLPTVGSNSDLNVLSPAQLGERRSALQHQLELNQAEVKNITAEQSRINDIKRDLDDINGKLASVKDEIDKLNTESDALFSGRIEISDWGLLPTYPAKDRRKQLGLVGFVGGFGMSCALFFLLGTIDRRTYTAAQLANSSLNYRLLGVLPYLGARDRDEELSETATQCVHQIRNRIEATRAQDRSSMIVVTSPYQGDGKTSLAMALGWSYAASGYRTLLLDCDLLGRNLTDQIGLSKHDGVKEVLRDRHLGSQIVDLPVPNLSVLGAGRDTGFGPESIRRDDFASLCGELRQRYDIIITDTGPFIGSVELLPVTAASDGVVFSVRRGRSRSRLEDCLDDLNTIDVPCLGVVLNCADRSDCERYVSKSTISMRQQVEAEGAVNGNGNGNGAAVPRPVRNALIKAMEKTSKSRN